MKWLFKWTFRLLLTLIALTALIGLLRNQVFRPILEAKISRWTGLETFIGKASIELRSPRIVLHDVSLKNPPGTSNRAFLEAPLIVLEYDPFRLLSRELYLREVDVRVTEVNLFRRQAGHSTQARLQQSLLAAAAPDQEPFWPCLFRGAAIVRVSALGKYSYLDYHEMARSQEVELRTTNAVATRILTLSDLSAFLQRTAAQSQVAWPPADVRPGTR